MEHTISSQTSRHKTTQKTERSRFTRMCIGESIIELMQKKGLTVLVSRQSRKKPAYPA